MTAHDDFLSLPDALDVVGKLRGHVSSAILGQKDLIDEALCCMLAGGHILITGAPGLAKTTLVRTLARGTGLQFGRVQFTPDLLPTDIIGSDILNIDNETGKRFFEFTHGPVFANLLLADEINRASPRTQSALLEAMQERKVTVGRMAHFLPEPFMVFATQNPFESEGTFPLPEAQLDRFLLHTLVSYPDRETEEKMLRTHAMSQLAGEQIETAPVARVHEVDRTTVLRLIERCKRVQLDNKMIEAITALVRSSRPEDPTCPKEVAPRIWYGAGPRAGISLISTVRSLAMIEGEERVRWRHVVRLAKPVLRHRIRLNAKALRDGMTEDATVDVLLQRVEKEYEALVRAG